MDDHAPPPDSTGPSGHGPPQARTGGSERSPRDGSTSASSLADGVRRLVALHRDARRRNTPCLIFLHTPWGGGVESVVKEWRRHLLGERESLFEASCRAGGGTYAPLRDIVSRYVRSLDDLGLLDDEISTLVSHVSGVLGLSGLPGLGEPPLRPRAEAGGQLQFFEYLGRLFIGLGQRLPATLLLLDVHRADSATRVAVRYLCDNVFSDALEDFAPVGMARPRFPGTVVLTGTEEAIAGEGLARDLQPRRDVHLLSVRTAEEASFRTVLQDDHVITTLMRTTGGSVALLRELLESLPGRLQDLRHQQIGALQDAERMVLEALAVAGRPSRPDFLLRVAGVEGDAPSLSSLAELGLIHRQVSRGELLIDFPSPEARLQFYERIPRERRAQLHARIAALLEERSRLGEAVDLELIAHHFLHSDAGPHAIRHALEAADRLHVSYAFQRANEILVTVLDMPMDDPHRDQVLTRLVEVCVAMGDSDRAIAHNAARLQCAPADEHAAIHRRHGELLTERGSYDDALQRFDAASAALDRRPEDPESDHDTERLRIQASRAEAWYGKGDYERAIETARDTLRSIPDDCAGEPRRLRLRLSNTLGKVYLFLGEYERALEVFQENHRLARDSGWPDEEVRALFNQATIALQQRRHDDAERMFLDCIAFGEETANPLTRAFCLLNLAVVHHKTLRYAEALDAYLHGLAIFRQSGNELQYAVTAMNLGALLDTIGDPERARALLGESIEVSRRRDIKYFLGRAHHIHGLLELGAEHAADAQRHLDRALDVLGQTGASTFHDRIRIAQARAAHGLGNHALRDRILRELPCDGDDTDTREVRAERDIYRAVFLLEDGNTNDAIPLLEGALAVVEELDVHEHVWRARLHLGRASRRAGNLRRARALLQGSADLVEHIAQQLPEPLREAYRNTPERRHVRDELLAVEHGDPARPPDATSLSPTQWDAWRDQYAEIIGEDPRLHQIFRIVDRVASADSTILIQGESGTGKELVAEAIHQRSPRNDGPFVKVNCAAFVETLLLSELFGHERGAFTGATTRRKGRFELAEGGTLFLDEIGDISANTQVALLRVLQERTFERVGGGDTLSSDARIICATNRNLEELVREGTFRLDLYYRLKGVVLDLPPLRERRPDIPRLVHHFSRQLARDGQAARRFSEEAMAWLVRYSWPGNVRELENFLRSMLLFVDGPLVELRHITQFRDFFADGAFLDTTPEWLPDTLRNPAAHPTTTPPPDEATQ
ncbi:MAG: AAA family ATPase, partial [Deltaproteobacteria bacterium]